MLFQEKEIVSFSWEKLVLTEVSETIYFTQFRIQLFIPEVVCSVETDNSKMFLEKIELTELGNRPVLKYSYLGWNPTRLSMNHSLGLNSSARLDLEDLNKGSVLDCTHRLSLLSKHMGPLNLQSSVVLLCIFVLVLSATLLSLWHCLKGGVFGFRQVGFQGLSCSGYYTEWRNSLFVLASTCSVTLSDTLSGTAEQNDCMDLLIWPYRCRNPTPKYRHLYTSRLSRQALKTYGLILPQ